MTWSKISSTEDLICYENKAEGLSVRLEARHQDGEWMIYRGFYTEDNLNYTEEFSAKSKEEAEKMILRLKKEKAPSTLEITELVKNKNRRLHISFKRAFRDDSVEKWYFAIGSDTIQNFFYMREFERVEIDIVLHKNYKQFEDSILKEIEKFLSLEEINIDIEQRIFYFDKSIGRISGSRTLNKFEVELGFKG